MTKEQLQAGLNTHHLGKELYFFESTDSTNAQARALATQHNLSKGTCIIALQQHQGKGTDGNAWHSAPGNLYLSIVFPFDQNISSLFPLYPAVALAQILNDNYHIDAHVKWPNDILVGTKKIAGILCEGIAKQFVIMGIGINIQQTNFKGELANIATSIAKESSTIPDIKDVFQDFVSAYEGLFYGKVDIRQAWIKHSKMIGKTIQTTQDGHKKSVLVTGLSPDGFLEVTTPNGTQETWMARRGLDINTHY